MRALAHLQHLAADHIDKGHASREILIGDALFDDAVAEASDATTAPSALIVGGITFIPARNLLPDTPLSQRGFGV